LSYGFVYSYFLIIQFFFVHYIPLWFCKTINTLFFRVNIKDNRLYVNQSHNSNIEDKLFFQEDDLQIYDTCNNLGHHFFLPYQVSSYLRTQWSLNRKTHQKLRNFRSQEGIFLFLHLPQYRLLIRTRLESHLYTLFFCFPSWWTSQESHWHFWILYCHSWVEICSITWVLACLVLCEDHG